MISLEDCKAYLSECQALAAEAKLSLRRATAVLAVCDAWLALRDAILIRNYRRRGRCRSSALETRWGEADRYRAADFNLHHYDRLLDLVVALQIRPSLCCSAK
jgi:hypothetical protein